MSGLRPLDPYSYSLRLSEYNFFSGVSTQSARYKCRIDGCPAFRPVHAEGILELAFSRDSNAARAVFRSRSGKTYFDFNYLYYQKNDGRAAHGPFANDAFRFALRQDFDLLFALNQDSRHGYSRGDSMLISARSHGSLAIFVVDSRSWLLRRIDVTGTRRQASIVPQPAMTGKHLPESFVIISRRPRFILTASRCRE